ncbi:hypothetical protein DET65_4091 [Sunxiuqinia elliptica]|uniref:Uncharacterized protein n=1 Tax=Sunxiuqinia elliptica TaxID=655355 RepID=A0A4R6GWF8_9BACT|nr:hypothetical protein DET52_107227 [Sunxiuqinia elliptica]TDO56535.1 hypothetical protein DET65_4091 [Sunxiuqinia elliptica]
MLASGNKKGCWVVYVKVCCLSSALTGLCEMTTKQQIAESDNK